MDVNNRTSGDKSTTTTTTAAVVRDCTVHFFLGPPGSGAVTLAGLENRTLGLTCAAAGGGGHGGRKELAGAEDRAAARAVAHLVGRPVA